MEVQERQAVLSAALNDLSRVLAECQDPKLILSFLESLLTVHEATDIAGRWELVQRLAQGESQRQIAQHLGVSLCKITRGSKELKKTDSSFRRMLDLKRSLGS